MSDARKQLIERVPVDGSGFGKRPYDATALLAVMFAS
jgi:hypothetical protein